MAMEKRMYEDTKGRKASTYDTSIAFNSGPDHDGDVVPSRVVVSDGGVGIDADDAYG